MVAIYNEHIASTKIQEAISVAAVNQRKPIGVFEDELIHALDIGYRTLQTWKAPSSMPETINDGKFYGLLYLLLNAGNLEPEWLHGLLSATSTPVIIPIPEELLRAYMRQARINGSPLGDGQIETFISRTYQEWNKARGLQGLMTRPAKTTLEPLIPLEDIARDYISQSSEICVSGLSLYRYIEAYFHDFVDALRRGTKIRVILPLTTEAIVDLIAFRSLSEASHDVQKQRIESTIQTIDRMNQVSHTNNAAYTQLEYIPSYGLTIYRSSTIESVCQVRLYTFKTPTSQAPTILARVHANDGWFDFFANQFELMWLPPE